ncbi:MAG: aminotransferase class V-fold PLP-dependent enzyme [Candidatus Latescibacterota bacterium]|nr:aminotransferase class V-fold PLP-dependent enzyme [Candidatus Latescibacterota bacterium]
MAVEIGKARGVPVIVDAAYEIPPKNLWYYTKEVGVDAAIFSGGKALRGPSSTGLIVGRKEIVVS